MRIFLSYSRDDLKIAEQIAAHLTQAGHDVFFDRHSIKVAEDYNRVIWQQIRKAHLFVFLISPHAVDEGSYTLTELELAEKKWPNPERRVLPVVIAPTEIGRIPIYATLVDMLQPEGNLAAEVRTAVRGLNRRHRIKTLWRSVATLGVIALAGLLGLQGYRAWLDHGPIAARTRLADMNVPFTDIAFVQSARRGDLNAVKLFLAAGMDPNSVGDNRFTALEEAIDYRQFEVVGLLLEAEGISVDRALAIAAGQGQEATVSLLLEAGAAHAAVNDALVAAARDGQLAVLRLLLAGEVEQAALNNAFVAAAERGKVEVMRFLRDRISSPGEVASRALLEAVRSDGSRLDSLRFLFELGADANTGAADGDTPLIRYLRRGGQPEVVRLLLARGADVKRRGSDGYTALMRAAGRDEPVLTILLEQGADVDAHADNGETALMLAALYGNVEAVEVLLAAGADIDAICACPDSSSGATALIRAVERNRYRVVEVLIANGADVNSKDSQGQSALMYAADRGFRDMVHVLLQAGARPADVDKRGRSAETLARRREYTEIIELLQAAPGSPAP